jgi:hypothetical protein
MASSGTLRRVALVRSDVSEECSAYIIRVTRIGELGTTLAVTSSYRNIVNIVPSSLVIFNLKMEAIRSSETSDLTKVRWRHIPEDGILHSHRRENLKSYMLEYLVRLLSDFRKLKKNMAKFDLADQH